MRAIRQIIRIALFSGAIAGAAFGEQRPAAAPGEFVVREWHHDDGLPSEDVTQLLQDHLGYLWVATRAGLMRFDGTTFIRYPDAGREMCVALCEGADGRMLVVPRIGDPLIGPPGSLKPAPLPEPHRGRAITAALIAPDDAHWFATRGAVLRVANGSTQVFGPDDGISAQSSAGLAVDAKARVWIASETGLARYEAGHLTRVSVPGPASELRIGSSSHGGPWVITSTHAYKIDDADAFEEFAELPALHGAHYVNAMREDRNGVLWIGTRSQGVHAIRRDGQVHVPTSQDYIFTLLEDREGTIWVGTNSGGLNAISPKIYRLFQKGSGLLENATTAICEDAEGAMWFANGDGGVVRLHGGVLRPALTPNASPKFGVISVAPNPAGGIWLTGAPGLFAVDPSTDELRRVPNVPAEGVRRVAYTDHRGNLWLSVDPDRVGRLSAGAFRTFDAADGFAAGEVRTFAEDAAGTLWIGTADGKVLHFDGNCFHALPISGEPLGAINAIAFDETSLLLGTSRRGLAHITGDRVVLIRAADGLPEDNVAQIVTDAKGDFWCGSGRGVYRVGRVDLHRFVRGEARWVTPLLLGKDEGLRSVTCLGLYGPGAIRSRDGDVWFAAREGVLAITPTAPMLNPAAPRVAIEEARCDGQALPLSDVAIVPPGTRKVEFRFSVLSLSAPSRAQWRYRLEGYDTDWNNAGRADRATYSHLSPGRYRFTVHAGFGTPEAGEQSASIALVVEAQWWQTRVFQAGAFLALIAAVVAIVRAWSHRRLRERLEKLERETAVARERARIAQNIHDDVGASLTRISLLTQTSSPGGGGENLNQIYETARDITRSLDEIVWAVNPDYDSLESFITYLSEFAQKFLNLAAIRCRFDVPATVPSISLSSEVRHDLFLCCREALNNIVKHANATEVVLRLTYAAPTLIIVISDNGCGFTAVTKPTADDRVSSGHGLGNLQRRMQQLGGSVSFSESSTGGTIVALSLALKESKAPS